MIICTLENLNLTSFSQIDNILHKLSPSAPTVSFERLTQLLKDADFKLFVAKDDKNIIVGMLTLTACQTITRTKYWIEDVIVDEAFRGMGIGRALLRAAVGYVKNQDRDSSIYLTSNPSRIAARALYQSEGFEEYKTGVFRIKQF